MLTREDHTKLRKIWHAALDLIMFGKPNDYEQAHERWIAAAPKIHETFAAFLDDHDPYLTPKATVDHNSGGSPDRSGVVGDDEVPGANGL